MKRISLFVFVLSLVLIFAAFPVLSAHAAGVMPQTAEPVAFNFDALLASFKSLTGVAMLIAAFVNVLKTVGVVKDGQANTWSAGMNMIALLAFFIAQLTGYSNAVPAFDAQAGEFSNVVGVAFAFVWQLYASRKTYDIALAGLPVIGTSNSKKLAGTQLSEVIEIKAEG